MKTAFLGVMAMVVGTMGAGRAEAASFRYQCACPKPSCAVYGQKRTFLYFNDERPTEIQFRYIDGPVDHAESQVDLMGGRVTKDESDSTAYFRELLAVNPSTRQPRPGNKTTGSYLKVEKTLVSGGDRGRLQWVGEREQGSFALLYLCTQLSD